MSWNRVNFTQDCGLFGQGACYGPLALAAGVVTTLVSAVGTIASGASAKSAADWRAEQMRAQGVQVLAGSQRQAEDKQLQEKYVQSKLVSEASASGASATDPTVVKLGSDIAGRGEQQALMDLYNGQTQKNGLDANAGAEEASGSAARSGSYFGAAGTLIGGIGNSFSKYAQGGFSLSGGSRPSWPMNNDLYQ